MKQRAMAWGRRGALAGAAAALLLGCPMGPFAGGRLSGEAGTEIPDDWGFVADVELCQIETNPDGDPYSVNTWCAGEGPNLYVPSSMIYGPLDPAEREWVANVENDPRVRVRVADVVYEFSAVRVDDEDEYGRVRALLESKYDVEDDDLDPARAIWIYRMEPR